MTARDIKVLIRAMRKLSKSYDTESAHSEADGLLCEAVRVLAGAQAGDVEELIAAWEAVDKWYA